MMKILTKLYLDCLDPIKEHVSATILANKAYWSHCF